MIQKVSCFLLILTYLLGFKCIIGFLMVIVKVRWEEKKLEEFLAGLYLSFYSLNGSKIKNLFGVIYSKTK
jgi:hypothetical protein